jgi:hypothetical protein
MSAVTRILFGGGTRARPPGELRSPLLRQHGDPLIADCVGRFLAAWPGLAEGEGPHAAEDFRWHLNYLDAALALGDPSTFQRYGEWVVRHHGPRGLSAEQVASAFDLLADAIEPLPCAPDLDAHHCVLVSVVRETAARLRAPAESENTPGREDG